MTRLRFWMLLGLGWVLCQTTWAAEDADSVINRYLEAMGGQAALAKIQSRVLKGTFSMPDMGMSGNMEVYTQEPDKYRANVEFGGMGSSSNGVNGDVAWDLNPMVGPRILEGAERRARLRQAVIDPLMDWKQFFAKAEVAGEGTVEGKPCTKLVLSDAEGLATSMYFDKETNLLSRLEVVIDGQTVQTDLSNYRKVGEVMVAHKMHISLPQFSFDIDATSVEDNTAIPAEKFEIPPDVKALIK
jgi:hypothetical protein